MRFHLQAVHVKVDRNFEAFAREKFERCEKFFFSEPTITLIIKQEGDVYLVEAKAQSKHGTVFVKVEDEDLNRGVEMLVRKLKNQIIRIHEKKVEMSHKPQENP